MVSFKIISIDSSVNNNNNKLCIEKLDASIDFHIAIMKKNQEEYVSTASILFKVMAFDQFISNTGILRDLLSRRLHAKCLSGKYKITYCSRYPARLSSEQKEKYANQILVFNQLNSDTVYYKLRNCNQHLNGPNFCSASLDLLLKLLSDNLTNFSYSLQVLHKVDGLFAITDMFHLIWLNEKPTGLFPKLDIQERGVKRYGINQLKKIVDVFEKTLLLACGAGSFVPDAFQSNGVNTNDRNQLNLAQENVDYLFDGDNSFYFNIKAKWIDLLVEKLHENAPNAVFLLLSVKLFLFFAHQSQYQFNSEPLDQHLKSKSYNHVIISLSQLNEALGRFVYLLSQSNLVD
ncbi:MAG: hypothetical protein VW397_07210, partial [Candidatus Margulisiibacteriota bacterium]